MPARKYFSEEERKAANRAKVDRYRFTHREEVKQARAAIRLANLEACRIAEAQYKARRRIANPAIARAEIDKVNQYRRSHPEEDKASRVRHIDKKYGCPTHLADLWEQACRTGTCEICDKPASENRNGKLHKDHSHTEPPVPRGCLCVECNRGLGAFKDSPDLLTKAIQYLLARDPRYSK